MSFNFTCLCEERKIKLNNKETVVCSYCGLSFTGLDKDVIINNGEVKNKCVSEFLEIEYIPEMTRFNAVQAWNSGKRIFLIRGGIHNSERMIFAKDAESCLKKFPSSKKYKNLKWVIEKEIYNLEEYFEYHEI